MTAQASRFTGKVAIVTGASRGIGLAIAQRFVDEGANVIITARGQETLDAAVAQLGAGPEMPAPPPALRAVAGAHRLGGQPPGEGDGAAKAGAADLRAFRRHPASSLPAPRHRLQ